MYFYFKGNILHADLTDMQLISKYNKGIWFFLCVTDIYGKYVWVVLLKNKKGTTITNAFKKFLDESKWRKTNKKWGDKGSEFYKRSIKSWLEDNGIEIYSTYNEENYVVAERFIRSFKNKTCKYMIQFQKKCILIN